MSTRSLQSYLRPVRAAIADGAVTPDPGTVGAMVFSTTTGGWLYWSGAAWTVAADTARVAKAGDTMTGALTLVRGAAANPLLNGHVTGDAAERVVVGADGKITWGSGSGAGDTNLYRTAADTLRTDDGLSVGGGLGVTGTTNLGALSVGAVTGSSSVQLVRATAGDATYLANVTGDTQYRLRVNADGKLTWGSGSATQDTNLYRDSADTLKTDDSLVVGTNLSVTGTTALTGTATAPTAALGTDTTQVATTAFVQAATRTITVTTQTGTTYTITATDHLVIVNNAAMVATLPSAVTAGAGRTYLVKNVNAAAASVIATAGTIDGVAAATGVLLYQYESATFVSDGTNWHRV